jgi:hypothetical protein
MSNNAIFSRLKYILFICISAVCFSCASNIPLSQSKWDANFQTYSLDNPANSYQFPKTNISFSVYNNSENLQIILIASDKSAQQMLLGNGFTIWADINALKNQYYGITFPMAHPQKNLNPKENNQSKTQENIQQNSQEMKGNASGGSMQGGPDIKFMIDNQNLSGVTEYYKGKETKLEAGSSKIVYEKEQLYYIINFSLKKLSQYDITGNTISLGLMCENKNSANGNRPGGGNGGMQGPPPGGGMNNDMDGGMGGGMRQGPPDMQQGGPDQSTSSNPINSWVKINLASIITK